MRKSLLITSALGLVATALPTLAMAGAAVGSSSAVCGSGFFAQFDAKIMNAKLEIKNEKTKEVEQSDSTVEADLIAAQEAAYAKMEVLFAGLNPTQTTKLRNTVVNGGLNITRLLNATSDKQIKLIVLHALKGGADDLATLIAGANAPTAAQLDAISDADITNALAYSAAGGGNVGALVLGAGLAPITVDQFNRAVEDAKTLRAVILADEKQSAIWKAAPAAGALTPSLMDVQNTVFANKTLISGQADNVSDIRFAIAPNMNIAKLSKLYVLAGSALGADTVARTFDIAKAEFLNADGSVPVGAPAGTLALKVRRANRLRELGWFNESVENQKGLIAKANELVKKNNEFADRRVHHHALAGGVGATVGWWQNLGGFALSISGSGDYLWGTFRVADDAAGSTVKAEDKRRLGFGFQGDVGAHYVVSPSTTLGILVGLRGQQLNIGRNKAAAATTTTTSKESKGDYASKWMINPVVTLQARTFFTDTVYGALSVGYVIPIEKDYKLENTNITNKDAKIRFQGLTGAFSVGMMF